MILGIDVGSTHTDAVLLDGCHIVGKAKTATTKDRLFLSLREVVGKLNLEKDQFPQLDRIVLSTTLTTNALVENKVAEAGLILMNGPGVSPSHVALGNNAHFVGGYIDHRGAEAETLDRGQLKQAREALRDRGISCLAVVGKFSPRNPSQELQAAEELSQFAHVSLGHRLSGQLNYPRRVAAAYLNASIWEIYNPFVLQVTEFFREQGTRAPLYILKADGGAFDMETSKIFPVQTVLSGPAASIMGILAGNTEPVDMIALDIGGTTTDIAFFVDGMPLLEPMGVTIGGHKTCIRGLRTRSIGIGGDSAVRLLDGNLLIGPQRNGPAASLGGPSPTPTDAMVILGLTGIGRLDLAIEAIKPLAEALGRPVEETAETILDATCRAIVREIEKEIKFLRDQPVYTIHEFLWERSFAPKGLTVVGGPAGVIAPRLAAIMNCPFKVPEHAEVSNAIGAALSRISCEMTLLADTEHRLLTLADEGRQWKILPSFSRQEAREIIKKELRQKALAQGADPDEIDIEIIEDLEYPMIRDHYRTGRNMRIRAQLRPGLIGAIQ